MSKLLSKYESRIKNFVLKMSESPYIIKKYKSVYSPKHPLQIPISTTFYQKNAFSFKKYKSDRERINEILERNTKLEEYYKKMNKEKEKLKKIYQIKFAPKLIQPNMHFQYKNEDSKIRKKLAKKIKELSSKSKSVDNYNIIEENVSEMDNNNEQIYNRENNTNNKFNMTEGSNFSLTEEQIRQKKLHKKIIEDRNNMINTRKLLMNLESVAERKNSKYSLSEIYRKTEFKAMENLKIFKTSVMNKNILNKWKKDDEEKLINIKLNNFYNDFYNNCLTRNNKSNTEFSTTKNVKENNSKTSLKKIYSMDEFDLNTNRSNRSNINHINKEFPNFNIIKEKPNITKRRMLLSENKKILQNFNITREISSNNPLLFNLYFMNKESKEKKEGINQEQFDEIKKMAFKETKHIEVSANNNENEKTEEELFNEENNGTIKKNKKVSVDKLAENLLKETNWTLKNNYKSKYEFLNNEEE